MSGGYGTQRAVGSRVIPSAIAQTPSRMKLGAVSRGLLDEPLILLIYGPEGVGKTSFCAGAPRPIFVSAADGTGELDVERFPKAESYQEILDTIEELRTTEHGYRSIVVDELGKLEPLVWAHVCARDHKADIEAYGFGKGYGAALGEWRIFADKLSRLRMEKRMNVLLTAHSEVKTFKNPDADVGDYDRYQLKLNSSAGGMLKEWSNVLLFAEFETVAKKATNAAADKRQVGVSTGARVIHTQRTAAYDAKNRLGLPEELPLSWAEFEQAARKGKELRRKLAEALRSAPEATREDVRKYIEKEGYRLDAYETAIAGLVPQEVK
jgi:hypothetical protein